MSEKTAIIWGATGQDGSYLSELLLEKGYAVHGVVRKASNFNTQRLDHIYGHERLTLHHGDMLDYATMRRLIGEVHPTEAYNLAAQSHVRVSFDLAVYTAQVVGIGTLNLLEAIRDYQDATGNVVRMYQASSSEMFGSSAPPQNESTPFKPRSPYACAKVHAFFQCVNYREAYGLHVANGILFNHESPRRGETFVTRKITRAATRIKLGLQKELILGNLDSMRDWGYAGDYVHAMWLMLQHDKPDDYVIATGKMHSVREWLLAVFGQLDLSCDGYVGHSERFVRPTEVDALCGDSSKASKALGWRPVIEFDGLRKMMVESDMQIARRERLIRDSQDG